MGNPLLSTAPALIVGGAEHRLTPPKYAEFMAARIPSARLVMLPAGHYPHVEQEARFNAALAAFLGSIT